MCHYINPYAWPAKLIHKSCCVLYYWILRCVGAQNVVISDNKYPLTKCNFLNSSNSYEVTLSNICKLRSISPFCCAVLFTVVIQLLFTYTESILRLVNMPRYNNVHGANIGPTWVVSAPDVPHVGPMNLAIGLEEYLPECQHAYAYSHTGIAQHHILI